MKMKKAVDFRQKVVKEIARIRRSGYVSNSLHEGYALMKEEFEEFWDEVKLKPAKRKRARIIHELVQVAALAEVIVEDNL